MILQKELYTAILTRGHDFFRRKYRLFYIWTVICGPWNDDREFLLMSLSNHVVAQFEKRKSQSRLRLITS